VEPEIYTIEEAAKILKVSDDTVRKMIKNGELEARKIRGQWRIRREAIDRLFTEPNDKPRK
jgi:excisionase family DNA binding protein